MKWILQRKERRLLCFHLFITGAISLLIAWIWSHSLEGGAVAALSEKGTRGEAFGGETSAAVIVTLSPSVVTSWMSLGILLSLLFMSLITTNGFREQPSRSSSSSSSPFGNHWNIVAFVFILHIFGTLTLHLIAVLLGAPLRRLISSSSSSSSCPSTHSLLSSRFIKTLIWASIASSLCIIPPSSFLLFAIHTTTEDTTYALLLRSFLSSFRTTFNTSFFTDKKTRGGSWKVGFLLSLFNSFCALFGAWLGAIPGPLDWDLPWQFWPTASIYSTLGGYTLGCIISIVWLFLGTLKPEQIA